MDKLGLYKYIENHIKTKLDFLNDLGYKMSTGYNYIDGYGNTDEGGDLNIIFENKNIDRALFLTYIYIYKNKTLDSFSFRLRKENDGFSVKDYMLFIQQQEIKYLWLKSFEGTFEEKLDQLLDYVVNILQTYLMPVLKGEEWVDVPTNWYGTK
jgi:hypothetical protein